MTTRLLFSGDDVDAEVEGRVVTITLQRPPVNAFRTHTWHELSQALEAAGKAEESAVLVLRSGVPGIFSAGADVKELPMSRETSALRQGLARSTLSAFAAHPVPVLAVIDGAVIGGGCSLVSQCDIRIASPRSRFAIPEIDVARAGGARHLMRHLDEGTVRWMALSGGSLAATDAHARGLVTLLAEDVEQTATRLAGLLAAKSPTALRVMKQAIDRASLVGVDDGYEVEQQAARLLGSSPDAAEAAAAFLGKRTPVWGPVWNQVLP